MTRITRARHQDVPALARIMHRAVQGAAPAYTARQRRAWVPHPPPVARFATRLSRCEVWVARGCHGPEGFVAIRRDGYVDLTYVLPQAQGRGLFRQLVTRATAGKRRCRTHASLLAQPAFAALGFEVVRHEIVRQRGQRLRRAEMLRH